MRDCWGVIGPEIKENQGACVGGPRKQGLDESNMFTLALEELWQNDGNLGKIILAFGANLGDYLYYLLCKAPVIGA